MCSLALEEVVNYYRNGRSYIYACFMDASKAFDRIRHDKKILQDRGIHPLAVRLIIDMYKRQKSRTSWNNVTGEYFNSINGVQQGRVVSPLMFTVYIDELICRLQSRE